MNCIVHQAPLSLGFFGQEYWCGLSFPTPGDFPDPRVKTLISCLLPLYKQHSEGQFLTKLTMESQCGEILSEDLTHLANKVFAMILNASIKAYFYLVSE